MQQYVYCFIVSITSHKIPEKQHAHAIDYTHELIITVLFIEGQLHISTLIKVLIFAMKLCMCIIIFIIINIPYIRLLPSTTLMYFFLLAAYYQQSEFEGRIRQYPIYITVHLKRIRLKLTFYRKLFQLLLYKGLLIT